MVFGRHRHVYEEPADDARPVQTSRASATRTRSWSPVGSGEVMGLVGAAAVIVSLFLPWREGGVHVPDVPAAFLWDRTTSSTDPSLLVFLIPAAALLVLGLVPRIGAGIRLLGAIVVLAVTGLFAYQLNRSLFAGTDLGDVLDSGFYVAAVGGVVAFVSAFAASRSRVRRDVVRHDRTAAAPTGEARVVESAR